MGEFVNLATHGLIEDILYAPVVWAVGRRAEIPVPLVRGRDR
jgi:hypothetical protein